MAWARDPVGNAGTYGARASGARARSAARSDEKLVARSAGGEEYTERGRPSPRASRSPKRQPSKTRHQGRGGAHHESPVEIGPGGVLVWPRTGLVAPNWGCGELPEAVTRRSLSSWTRRDTTGRRRRSGGSLGGCGGGGGAGAPKSLFRDATGAQAAYSAESPRPQFKLRRPTRRCTSDMEGRT